MASEKLGYYLITDTISYVLFILHTIPFFIRLLFNKNFTYYCFFLDVNSWMRGTHEFHVNWATTNSNDSIVYFWLINESYFCLFFFYSLKWIWHIDASLVHYYRLCMLMCVGMMVIFAVTKNLLHIIWPRQPFQGFLGKQCFSI